MQQRLNKYELDQQVQSEMAKIFERTLGLFEKLKREYGEDVVLDLIQRECDVSPAIASAWLSSHRSIPDGNAKQIYHLLKEAWECPRPTDFPAPKAEAAPALPPKPVVSTPPPKARPRNRRPNKPKIVSENPIVKKPFGNITSQEAGRLLSKMQKPGGSVLESYKPDE